MRRSTCCAPPAIACRSRAPAAAMREPSRPLCCGRTYLAAGLVDEAKREARRVVAALAPHVERGAAIVGLEPSCLLSLRDEFLVMGLGEAAQAARATSALLIEEFLAREHAAGRLKLALAALPETRALLHGHCHQKAFDAVAPREGVLRLIPGLAVDVVEIELLRHGRQLRPTAGVRFCYGQRPNGDGNRPPATRSRRSAAWRSSKPASAISWSRGPAPPARTC